MDNALLMVIALFLYFTYKKKEEIPSSWLEPSFDYWQVLPVGTIPVENSVMQYKVAIMKAGQDNHIEGAIIAGIIAKESKGVANPPNPKKNRYIGLMQFGLSEARAMGYTGSTEGLLDPQSNIFWGSKYLKYCIDHKNTLEKGISGYNTGNVEKENTPFNADYVNVVASYVPRFRYLLSQSFPGYANVFPKETWLKTDTVYA
jgi:soluble lytic murein transglycosylase-like protein